MSGSSAGNVARGGVAANTLALNPILRIHPAIGVARVGDSPGSFFIGPERPFAGSTGVDAGVGSAVPPFRDGGKVKRQAARFRIFQYFPDQSTPVEINLDHPDVAEIEWTVHLANKKAAFFQFDGQRGASGPFGGAVQDRRNKSIPAAQRDAKLVIDPGSKSIKGPLAGPNTFDSGSGNWPKNTAGTPLIDYLGELRTDNKGRLLVLGGRGKSVSSDALPPDTLQLAELAARGLGGPPTGAGRAAAPLLQYANNDTWFDDISDGPVTAKVKLKTGKTVAVQFPGWVLVGPPDFAPEIRNVISLYDTMLDVAVRELPDPAVPFYTPLDLQDLKSLKASLGGTAGFTPEWFFEIEPTVIAGFFMQYVFKAEQQFHGTLNIASLKSPAATDKPMREFIFNRLRPPSGNTAYGSGANMPKLFGDKYFAAGDPKRVAALTRVQHHIMELWKDGTFLVGTPGPSPNITPEGLDRAALESCVGGAFFPGIECSWLCRFKECYQEPFRIKHGAGVGPLTIGPGFFSQQMALPWQADFMDCAKDNGLGSFHGWWPGQRPDDVYTSAADAAAITSMVSWARGVPAAAPRGQSHANMVTKWNQLGFVVSATVSGTKVFFEQERTLP
jgi:hypothetical protein